MVLDDHDKEAVFALLARVHRLEEQTRADQKLIQEANARIVAANSKVNAGRSGLAIFGFNVGGANVWDEVRAVLGEEFYSRAIERGKRPEDDFEQAPTPLALAAPDPEFTPEDGDDPAVVEEAGSPKIRDAILEYLGIRGDQGARVADIKAFLKTTYNIETHEKTPGMTLYRLSQEEPPLVQRDGRIWFAIRAPQIDDEPDLFEDQPKIKAPPIDGAS